jgi:hypothetical protein
MNHKMKRKKNAPINKQQKEEKRRWQKNITAPVLKESHKIFLSVFFLCF